MSLDAALQKQGVDWSPLDWGPTGFPPDPGSCPGPCLQLLQERAYSWFPAKPPSSPWAQELVPPIVYLPCLGALGSSVW